MLVTPVVKGLKGLYNIGTNKHPAFTRFARRTSWLLLAVVVLELHKYGAWYTGNHTGYWRLWGYIGVPLLAMPGIIYVMGLGIKWVVDNNRYRLVYAGIKAVAFYLVALLVFGDVFLKKKFPDPGYFMGYIRSDGQFWISLSLLTLIFLIVPFVVFMWASPEDEPDLK